MFITLYIISLFYIMSLNYNVVNKILLKTKFGKMEENIIKIIDLFLGNKDAQLWNKTSIFPKRKCVECKCPIYRQLFCKYSFTCKISFGKRIIYENYIIGSIYLYGKIIHNKDINKIDNIIKFTTWIKYVTCKSDVELAFMKLSYVLNENLLVNNFIETYERLIKN